MARLPILTILSHLSTTTFLQNRLIHSLMKNSYSKNFLSQLAHCKKAQDLRILKSRLIVQGLITKEPFFIEFTKKCFNFGQPHLALSILELVEVKRSNLFLQYIILKHLCDSSLFEDTLLIFEKFRVLGCSSDNYTFPFVIKACVALGDFITGIVIHSLVLKSGFGESIVVQTALVGFYSKSGLIDSAHLVLDKMSEPDIVAWNAMISGCSFSGFDVESFRVFREMSVVGLKPNVSTLASVIPLCSQFNFFDAGKSLHGFTFKSGYDMEESLLPAFISMYGSFGEFPVARSLFDCTKHKNVAIWNSMISAYTKNRRSDCAFGLFHKLLQDGMQPDTVTFVSIVPCCESSGSISYCQTLHTCVIKFGLENQCSVATALLSMYAKLQDINSAEFLFSCMHQRNLMSWNSMVSAYMSNGLSGASLATFRQMQSAGFIPDAISIVSVLSACSELEAILPGKSAHGFVIKNGITSNLNVSNALLALYSECRNLSSSFDIFNRMMSRNVISWNTMISGCVYNEHAENALLLFHRMQKEGVDFDLVTLVSLLPACNESNDLILAITIHGYAIKSGLNSDLSLANALLSMYSNCGDLYSGILVFEDMPIRDVISWNALLTGYRNHNLQDGAMSLIRQMIEEYHKPNYVTWLNVLPLCYTLSEGKAIHGYAVRTAILRKIPFLTSLILMYARFGNARSCELLFRQRYDCNVYLWNAVISAYVRLKDARRAFTLFIELLRRGIDPDHVTVLTVISACTQLNNLVVADSIFAYLIREGFDKDLTINNALIDLYSRCGNILFSSKLFDLFSPKDPVSWSVMINAYGSYGEGEAALALFSQMRLLGTKPDEITYLSLLSACSHAGLVEQARTVFNCMIHDGLLPRIEHYACFSDLLGRTGHLCEAYDIVKSLPYPPSANILESVLGACLIHGNIEVGEEIGRMLIEMEPNNSSAYVILHNIYAAAGRWMDANQVRSQMGKNEVRKVPGVSLVEGKWNSS